MRADKNVTLKKLKTVKGQIEGLIKMVEDDRYCIDISNQLLACIGILKNINKDVLTAHLKHCVKNAFDSEYKADKKQKVEEIIMIMDKLTK
jgi:DNA-binding FrmR family transcriptional regulator